MPLNPLLFCVTHKTQPTEFQLQQACIVISRPNSIYRYFIKQKPSSSIILILGGYSLSWILWRWWFQNTFSINN